MQEILNYITKKKKSINQFFELQNDERENSRKIGEFSSLKHTQ